MLIECSVAGQPTLRALTAHSFYKVRFEKIKSRCVDASSFEKLQTLLAENVQVPQLKAHSSQGCCVDASSFESCCVDASSFEKLQTLLGHSSQLTAHSSQLTAHSSQLTELTELFVHFSMWVFNKFEPIECSVAGRPYKFSSELYRLIAQLVMIRSSSYTIRFLA